MAITSNFGTCLNQTRDGMVCGLWLEKCNEKVCQNLWRSCSQKALHLEMIGKKSGEMKAHEEKVNYMKRYEHCPESDRLEKNEYHN